MIDNISRTVWVFAIIGISFFAFTMGWMLQTIFFAFRELVEIIRKNIR